MKMLKVNIGLFCLLGVVVSTPTRPTEDTRIVGGDDIEIENAPYQLSLQIYDRHACGGSIMTLDMGITAAHCVIDSPVYIFSVRVGSSFSTTGGQIIKLADCKAHPEFTYAKMDNDIAVLKFATEVQINAKVAPIPLAKPGDAIETGSLTYVSGWGRTREGGALPAKLQMVAVPVVADEKCQDAYAPQYEITDNMLCAGVPTGGKDACQGDSGGPLVLNGTLVGVVSWGLGCARPEYPGVYTRVSNMRGWLEETAAYFRAKQLLRSPHEDLFRDRISSLMSMLTDS